MKTILGAGALEVTLPKNDHRSTERNYWVIDVQYNLYYVSGCMSLTDENAAKVVFQVEHKLLLVSCST